MIVEIMIVSYAKDIPWLEHCLNSIRKFSSGFRGVTLVVPFDERNEFMRFAVQPVTLVTYDRVGNQALWHLDHQVQKCRADEYCRDANFIAHVDSDCIFTEPVTPDDYIVDSKPVLLVESYSRLGNAVPWKRIVDHCLGGDNKKETMRRHPAVHHREIYKDLRNAIEKKHGIKFNGFVLAQKSDFPWGFSEFNMLGTIALTPRWRNKYTVIDLDVESYPKEKLFQFWSHGPIDSEQSAPHGERLTPKAVFEKYGV